MKWMRILLALLAVAVAGVLLFVPGVVEQQQNGTLQKPPYRATSRKIAAIDMHADSLLWGRDLSVRSASGHVDVPRLIEGGVALQAFTIVTKSPKGLNFDRNEADAPDDITLLSLVQLWRPTAWRSLTARVLVQADRFALAVERSRGKLVPIRSRADLDTYWARRERGEAVTAGFLGIEGAHALDGKLSNLDVVFDAGVRMMAPTHLFDSEFGGSAAGVQKGGLTPLGRELIAKMEQKRMLVDIAHASEQTIDDVLKIAKRPVVSSHTGVKGTCNVNRNLSDAHLKAIAATGGLVSIAYFDVAVCGNTPQAIAKAIRYAMSVAGVDHVALGSDFDGAVTTPFDTTGLGLLYDAIRAEGIAEEDLPKIAGLNALRVLRATLP